MNKFEKAQEILRELGGDGWLIICVENSVILIVSEYKFKIIPP